MGRTNQLEITLTEEEVDKASTPEERAAKATFQRLQREAIETGLMGETALLEASQAIHILVARNKRLGLIK